MTVTKAEVVVVGAGPSGLTAATELARRGAEVEVLDREQVAGGIPRHCAHPGYGMRDLHTMMSGPKYARRLVERAQAAGVTIHTGAQVTGWAGPRRPEVTSPEGRTVIDADAIVLATGARERPRSARMIPGDRPAGVYTTGLLQNLVHLHHEQVGTRAVIVGAELVSWSAALTLREAGCRTVLMTTEHSRADAYAAFTIPGRAFFRTPVATRTKVTRIIGRGRVSAIEIEDLDTGQRREVACDTIVFTGDWAPDMELARLARLEMNPGTRGPRVDAALRTSQQGVFAIGNLCHPVDTADGAALDGAHVAGPVCDWLDGVWPEDGAAVELVAGEPLRWLSPSVMRVGGGLPPRGKLLAWADRYVAVPRIVVRQDGRTIRSQRVAWPAAPGRVFRIPVAALRGMDPRGGPVEVSLG